MKSVLNFIHHKHKWRFDLWNYPTVTIYMYFLLLTYLTLPNWEDTWSVFGLKQTNTAYWCLNQFFNILNTILRTIVSRWCGIVCGCFEAPLDYFIQFSVDITIRINWHNICWHCLITRFINYVLTICGDGIVKLYGSHLAVTRFGLMPAIIFCARKITQT